ncbi:MAG: oxygen-independent coproporphyrinogen III oxidase [Leptospiraceae bacterium]
MSSFAPLPELDADLLQKYDRAGPRYTSYPTAPAFHDGFKSSDFADALAGKKPVSLGSSSSNVSLYFHIPYCDTLCFFCGCNMIVSNNRERIARYLDYLIQEIELNASFLQPGRKLEQLHWGGGTPTHLNPDEIRKLGDAIHSSYSLAADFEGSCEVDPRELTEGHLSALRDVGFHRISLGLQDLNPAVQKAVNRVQSLELTNGIVQNARSLGFDSVNIDLIYGLPLQTIDSFAATLEQVLEMQPDRIALFNFAYLPQMFKHHSVIYPEDLPSAGEKLEILTRSVQRICSRGYRFVGMDHFAKQSDELSRAQDHGDLYRNFQGYSTKKGLDLIAHGITGISQVGRTYSQSLKTEKEYFEALDSGTLPVLRGYELTDDDLIRRHVITELMCHFFLGFDRFKREMDQDFQQYFRAELEETGRGSLQSMQSDGLLKIRDTGLEVQPVGRFLIRNIAMCFDAHLPRASTGAGYSRTI